MKKYFSIAELKILIECDPGPYKIFLESSLESFTAGPCERPDICFRVDFESAFPEIGSCNRIFTSNPGGLWSILEDDQKSHYIIALQNVASDRMPYMIIRADRKFSDFYIYARPSEEGLLFPLEYPLADLAVSGHLNINKEGILLHSACVLTGDKCRLFSGVSGSGKSTISELWQKDADSVVLTDERVIIREKDGSLWAYGTPWHGTSVMHKNMGAPIEKIFFIKHGKENRATPISITDAANRLMVRCFPTFWNREGMRFALDFCMRISQKKESYELDFIPDVSIVEYVKKRF